MSASADPFFHVFNDDGEIVAIEGEQIKPNPMVWPVCDTCGASFILRRCLSFTTGKYSWAWMRDCDKPRSACKNATAQVHDAQGECPQTGREAAK